MPLDIVTPPISAPINPQDRWQTQFPRTNRPSASTKDDLFKAGPAPEISPAQTQPAGSSTAFLAQILAQAGDSRMRVYAAVPPDKAASIAQRYEIAQSRDAILRGESILFRIKA
jgi:hypothetical protein